MLMLLVGIIGISSKLQSAFPSASSVSIFKTPSPPTYLEYRKLHQLPIHYHPKERGLASNSAIERQSVKLPLLPDQIANRESNTIDPVYETEVIDAYQGPFIRPPPC